MRINQPKRINYDFTFNTLNWINNNCNTFLIQFLKTLKNINFILYKRNHLSIYICPRKIRTITRVGMIPTNNHFISMCLLQHSKHFLLKHRINRCNTHRRSRTRKSKNIHNCHCIIIHKLPKHESHNFQRDTGSSYIMNSKRFQ